MLLAVLFFGGVTGVASWGDAGERVWGVALHATHSLFLCNRYWFSEWFSVRSKLICA